MTYVLRGLASVLGVVWQTPRWGVRDTMAFTAAHELALW